MSPSMLMADTERMEARIASVVKEAAWPTPMNAVAMCGVAGNVVETIAPHTEADPAALLIQFLVFYGNVIGRSAHWMASGTPHHANLFAVVVGETARARKGTSADAVRYPFTRVDSDWAEKITNGLSSGEGLINAVRDASKDDEGSGISDKRLLVMEGEFARVLSVMERQGNTLSPVLRDAWDGKPMRVLTKTNPLAASQAHISIVAHITREELVGRLTDTSMANGFANRFLFCCAKRSNLLPFGGDLEGVQWNGTVADLGEAINHGRTATRFEIHPEAHEFWEAEYRRLGAGHNRGLLDSVTSRAEAQIRRIAMIYALLDLDSTVRLRHLQAALEVWRYCDGSCQQIFGNATGDPIADRIRATLRETPTGLTREQMRDLFSRHKSSEEIQHAVQLLEGGGLARCQSEPTAGRSAERWFAT